MLVEFRFKNYRSFRDETVLSVEAMGFAAFKDCLLEHNSKKILPLVSVYGKNGGGKSNVIRAFWVAVQFIRNAHRMQHENATVPVTPFALNDYSANEPTEFEFVYIVGDIKYWYSFAATTEKIVKESLYYAPKGQKSKVFIRKGQQFSFSGEVLKRNLISQAVAENQLYFSVACILNDPICINAIKWFRENIFFSRNYRDIPLQLLDFSNDSKMLKVISDYAKIADLGIEEMQFAMGERGAEEDIESLNGMKSAIGSFIQGLSENSNAVEAKFKDSQIKATARYRGINANGESDLYSLEIEEESDGAKKWLALASVMDVVLSRGGVLLVDGIEEDLHPLLIHYIIARFQSRKSNSKGAQLIFTTHNTDLMNLKFMRKDQIYFADKNKKDGVSKLFRMTEVKARKTDNKCRCYLAGKYGAVPDIEIKQIN